MGPESAGSSARRDSDSGDAERAASAGPPVSHLIPKAYEIDPLLCPYCGTTLRVIAFLIDFASLRRLLAHLGFAPQQPEPRAHSPPDEAELFLSNA